MFQAKKRFPLFRALFWVLGLILALCILIPVALMLFFNPNDYKKELNTLIQEKTHLPIQINGDLHIQYFPWLGLKANDISLKQPATFGQGDFAKAQSVGFQIPVRALLQGKLNIDSIVLNGIELHLVENTRGQQNWSAIVGSLQQSSQTEPAIANMRKPSVNKTQSPPSDTAAQRPFNIHLSQIDLIHATLHYQNQKTGQSVSCQNINLKITADEKPHHYQVQSDCELIATLTNPASRLSGQLNAKGNITLAPEPTVDLFLKSTFENQDLPKAWQKATLETKLIGNQKLLSLKDIHLNTATKATGHVDIPLATKGPIHFVLQLDHLDVDSLPIDAISPSKTNTVENARPSTAQTVAISQQTAPVKNSVDRSIVGDIDIKTISYQGHQATNVHATFIKEHQQIAFKPIHGNLYGGKFNLTVTHKMNQPQSPTVIKGAITQFQIAPLLHTLKQSPILNGQGTVHFDLLTTNTKPPEGMVACKIVNGELKGLDVMYFLQKARALLKGDIMEKIRNHEKTTFQALNATLKIHDNIIDNNDLLVDGVDFTAKGEGSIFLSDDSIAYKLKVMRIYHDGKEHANALPLALRIKGPLSSPSIQPDFDLYLKSNVKQAVSSELDKQVKKQIDKQLQKVLPQNDTDQDENQSTDNTQNVIEEALEKNIKKGLKKLFKK